MGLKQKYIYYEVARSGYVQPFFDGVTAFNSVAQLTPFVLLRSDSAWEPTP